MSAKQQITIGKGQDGEIKLDIAALIVSRMLITATSGGGKSWLLRKILEGVSKTTQTIVIDPEGEFATLREKRDMLLVGPDGEIPADPRSAGMLARRLMELNISAVIDIYELTPTKRREFVAHFCTAMVDMPKSLWRPCFIAVDETHDFAPEQDDYVSSEPLAALQSKGRKRGYCLMAATQRLSKLNKDVASEAKNRFVGQTALDVDQKRAADFLGFPKARWTELRDLSPPGHEGEWFAVGPALNHRGVVTFRAGMVETTHPKAGEGRAPEPPAPSKRIVGVLDELKDLSQKAEAEAKDIASARARIATLEKQLAAKPTAAPAPAVTAAPAPDRKSQHTIARLRKGLEDAMKVIAEITSKGFEGTTIDPEQIEKAVKAATGQIVKLVEQKLTVRNTEFEKLKREANSLLGKLQKLLTDDVSVSVGVTHNEPFTVTPSAPKREKTAVAADAVGREGLSGPERKIIDAIAWLDSIGVPEPENTAVAFLAGYTYGGGGFNNPRGSLRTKGLVEYLGGDRIKLTEPGRAVAEIPTESLTNDQLHAKVMGILGGPEQRILKPLLQSYPQAMTNEALAAEAGYTNGAGGYNNPRGRLRTLGLVEYRDGGVAARSILFPENSAA